MKKILVTLALCTIISACKNENKPEAVAETKGIAAVTPEMPENAIIYEANIRQYSPEGTFNAFAKDIPTLKKLGVKILWLMPIHEIGYEKRKADGKLSIEDIKDEKQKEKYLGSYYSVKDYRSINKMYGTADDFKNLVKTAHENGLYVILDWVANHTAWDHPWMKSNPDFYEKDAKGNYVSPFDWTDVVSLNYSNTGLRKAMFEDMKFWLTDFNIDGFRCDVAMEVPLDFWEQATAELNKVKPIFMLMEAEQPNMMKKAFDMQYGWTAHHVMNGIAKGEKTVADFDKYITENTTKYEANDIFMNFTSNHDENSWNGTEYERMGDAVETFAALSYTMPGMPLIYNGQEYNMNKRLKFFEKDTITRTEGKMMDVYEKLGKLKTENIALNGGKNPAKYTRIKTSSDTKILAFAREKEGKKVYYIANLTKEPQEFSLELQGAFTDYMPKAKIDLKASQKHSFKPWEYKILVVE